jgi:hypothetical protein
VKDELTDRYECTGKKEERHNSDDLHRDGLLLGFLSDLMHIHCDLLHSVRGLLCFSGKQVTSFHAMELEDSVKLNSIS